MNRTTRGLLIGALSGALLGTALAWAVLSRQDQESEDRPSGSRVRLQAGTGDWFRLGMSILQAGRHMADMVRGG